MEKLHNSIENLNVGETIVRICPETGCIVLAVVCEDKSLLCLHEDSIKKDREKVLEWINKNK